MKKLCLARILIFLSSVMLLSIAFGQTAFTLPEFSINLSGVEKIIYGKSGLERDLAAYRIGNGNRIMFIVFEMHGYEDAWERDGEELVRIGNILVERFGGEEPLKRRLEGWTIYIIPSANPDGLLEGLTNNGPGRATITTKIDINRSFPVGFRTKTVPRNFTGEYSLIAPEAKALYEFILARRGVRGISVLLDVHGWESSTLGDYDLGKYFNREFKSYHKNRYGPGYLITWSNSIGIKSALVEFPMPLNPQDIKDKDYAGKFLNGVLGILGDESIKGLGTEKAPEGNIIGKLRKGSVVPLHGEENNWYRIPYKDGYGYVPEKYIDAPRLESEESSMPSNKALDTYGVVNIGVINVLKKPTFLIE